jgi:hypothetical protein
MLWGGKMIIKNMHVEMDILLHGVSKPYLIYLDFEVDFERDGDFDTWIKSIELIEAIVVDRYNDDLQLKFIPDKNNFIFCEFEKQILDYVERKETDFLIDLWLNEQ